MTNKELMLLVSLLVKCMGFFAGNFNPRLGCRHFNSASSTCSSPLKGNEPKGKKTKNKTKKNIYEEISTYPLSSSIQDAKEKHDQPKRKKIFNQKFVRIEQWETPLTIMK